MQISEDKFEGSRNVIHVLKTHTMSFCSSKRGYWNYSNRIFGMFNLNVTVGSVTENQISWVCWHNIFIEHPCQWNILVYSNIFISTGYCLPTKKHHITEFVASLYHFFLDKFEHIFAQWLNFGLIYFFVILFYNPWSIDRNLISSEWVLVIKSLFCFQCWTKLQSLDCFWIWLEYYVLN